VWRVQLVCPGRQLSGDQPWRGYWQQWEIKKRNRVMFKEPQSVLLAAVTSCTARPCLRISAVPDAWIYAEVMA
jgi:hypothetical protein